MIPDHKFVLDDVVVELFAGCTKREREELLRVFNGRRIPNRLLGWVGREITGESAEQPAPLDLCPDVLYNLSTPNIPAPPESIARQEAGRDANGTGMTMNPPER